MYLFKTLYLFCFLLSCRLGGTYYCNRVVGKAEPLFIRTVVSGWNLIGLLFLKDVVGEIHLGVVSKRNHDERSKRDKYCILFQYCLIWYPLLLYISLFPSFLFYLFSSLPLLFLFLPRLFFLLFTCFLFILSSSPLLSSLLN